MSSKKRQSGGGPDKERPKKKPPRPRVEPMVESAPVEEDKREKARKRAQALVERAIHESTPEEEARTSALVAVRMISAEKLLEEPSVKHPIFERLEGLDDGVLDELGGFIEDALAMYARQKLQGGRAAERGLAGMNPQAVRWRAEAMHLQRKYDAYVGGMHWILQGFKIGLATRPTLCLQCGRTLQVGEIVVWKRRRFEAAHYICCIIAMQQQGVRPPAAPSR